MRREFEGEIEWIQFAFTLTLCVACDDLILWTNGHFHSKFHAIQVLCENRGTEENNVIGPAMMDPSKVDE